MITGPEADLTSADIDELVARLVAVRNGEYESKLLRTGARVDAIEAALIMVLELLADERHPDG